MVGSEIIVTESEYRTIEQLLGIKQKSVINGALFNTDKTVIAIQNPVIGKKIPGKDGEMSVDLDKLQWAIDEREAHLKLIEQSCKEGKTLDTFAKMNRVVKKQEDANEKIVLLEGTFFGDTSGSIESSKTRLEDLKKIISKGKKTSISDVFENTKKTAQTFLMWIIEVTQVFKMILSCISYTLQSVSLLFCRTVNLIGKPFGFSPVSESRIKKIEDFRLFTPSINHILKYADCSSGPVPVAFGSLTTEDILDTMEGHNGTIANAKRFLRREEEVKEIEVINRKINAIEQCQCNATDIRVCQCPMGIKDILEAAKGMLVKHERSITKEEEEKVDQYLLTEADEITTRKGMQALADLLVKFNKSVSIKLANREELNQDEKTLIKLSHSVADEENINMLKLLTPQSKESEIENLSYELIHTSSGLIDTRASKHLAYLC